MSRYLLTWNPGTWSQNNFDDYFARYEAGEILRWSCGTTKKIVIGDEFFLLKQGRGNRGIIGSGVIVKAPYSELHYKTEKAEKGEMALYVDLKFEYLSHPDRAIPVLRDELDSDAFSSHIWNIQGSGKTIPEEINIPLTALWLSRVETDGFISADEVTVSTGNLKEGAVKKINVNAYERQPENRRKCIDKWGHNCVVCNFHFELYYGSIGKQYIHVHHLKPLSLMEGEEDVNPVEDLRPVCPNCHAMLHKESSPISIEELSKHVKQYGTRP
jgi:5-methylcytosine-specific restriction enzyme A